MPVGQLWRKVALSSARGEACLVRSKQPAKAVDLSKAHTSLRGPCSQEGDFPIPGLTGQADPSKPLTGLHPTTTTTHVYHKGVSGLRKPYLSTPQVLPDHCTVGPGHP